MTASVISETFSFITIILIAAAVGMVIVNASRQESKTLDKLTSENIQNSGGSIIPLKVDVEMENNVVKCFNIYAKIRPGHSTLKYDDIAVMLYEPDNNSMLLYNSSSTNCSDLSVGGPRIFRVEPVVMNEKYREGRISEDDIVVMCFTPQEQIGDMEVIELVFIVPEGSSKSIKAIIPMTPDKRYMTIYP